MRQLNQSLHFVVFLFLGVLAAEAEPAAPERGEVPDAAAILLLPFFLVALGTRPGEFVPRRAPVEENGRSSVA